MRTGAELAADAIRAAEAATTDQESATAIVLAIVALAAEVAGARAVLEEMQARGITINLSLPGGDS